MKYRKKPVVVEATQWFKNGDHPDDNVWRVFEDTGAATPGPREGLVVRYYRLPGVDSRAEHTEGVEACQRTWHEHGWIDTAEGGHNVCPGDWIITGVSGERYPCKPLIFEQTYERVEEAAR